MIVKIYWLYLYCSTLMDFKKIKKLIDIVQKAQISELAVEENGLKVEIHKFGAQTVAAPAPVYIPAPAAAPSSAPATSAPAAPTNNNSGSDVAGLTPIVSPMVGTFYIRPDPNSPPFVEIGSKINKGQTVCIVEAMKLFNEIECDISGKIEKILVKDGDPVDFGQALMLVKV